MIDLSRPWTDLPLCVLDFETTGVDPSECMPVQIAVVRYEDGNEVASASTLLNPGCPIPDEAAAIHGKTDAMVADAPSAEALADVLGSKGFLELHEHALPCAYNEPYDRTILHRFAKAQRNLWTVARLDQWVDPLVIVRKVDRWVKGSGRHKLTTTCERHGVRLDNAHDALGDCRATGALLFRFLGLGIVNPVPAAKLLQHTRALRQRQDAELQAYFRRVGRA